MDNLIHIVGEELHDWEEESSDTHRYSIFTQHLMLAEKISKHQHLSPRTSKLAEDDKESFHSADSKLATSVSVHRQPTPTENIAPISVLHSTTVLAQTRQPRDVSHTTDKPAQPSPADWTWRPSIPHRTSSMSTRRKKGHNAHRPDLATFHRRSCQLFTSLDSTLSNATSAASDRSRTSTSTPPSLTSSVTSQATSILDDDWSTTTTFPPFHLELKDPALTFRRNSRISGLVVVNSAAQLGSPRSSSQLSPKITTTGQIFWTSDATRQAEYAKIDAAHRGFKGFVKRVFPRGWAWAQGKRRNFCHRQEDPVPGSGDSQVDEDSVRRFRVTIAGSAEVQGTSRAATPMLLDAEIIADKPRVELEIGLVGKGIKKSNPIGRALAKVR